MYEKLPSMRGHVRNGPVSVPARTERSPRHIDAYVLIPSNSGHVRNVPPRCIDMYVPVPSSACRVRNDPVGTSAHTDCSPREKSAHHVLPAGSDSCSKRPFRPGIRTGTHRNRHAWEPTQMGANLPREPTRMESNLPREPPREPSPQHAVHGLSCRAPARATERALVLRTSPACPAPRPTHGIPSHARPGAYHNPVPTLAHGGRSAATGYQTSWFILIQVAASSHISRRQHSLSGGRKRQRNRCV